MNSIDDGNKGIAKNELAKKNGLLFLLYALFSLFSITQAFFAFITYEATKVSLLLVCVSFLPVLLLSVFAYYLIRRYSSRAELCFLVLAIPALLMFSWFILPNQVPDEIWYVYRALRFGGNTKEAVLVPLMYTFDELPATYAEYYQSVIVGAGWDSLGYASRDLSQYLGHMFFVSGVFLNLGKFLQLNPYVAFWLGRMGNALIYLVVGYLALKKTPIAKTFLFIFLLNPMLLELEASYSPDAILDSASILFWVYFFRVLLSVSPKKSDLLMLGATYGLMALSKWAYAFFGLALLLYLKKISSIKIRKWAIIFTTTALFLVIFYVYFLYQPTNSTLKDSLELLRQPKTTSIVMFNTFSKWFPTWISQMCGESLGSLNVSVWTPCFWTYLIMLFIGLFYCERDSVRIPSFEKKYLVIISVIFTFLLVSIFRNWSLTVEGATDVINGVQGRYFIPYAAIPFICAVNSDSQVNKESCYFKYSFVLTSIYCFDLFAIVFTFA